MITPYRTTPETARLYANPEYWRDRDRNARNYARRRAVSIIHQAWTQAVDIDVSSQLYRIFDYLVTPESMVEYSATARWHRENA